MEEYRGIFVIWIIYDEFYKQNVKITATLKYFRWYNWIISLLLLALTLYFSYVFFISMNFWRLILSYIFAILTGFYFGNELKKKLNDNIGSNKDIFDHDIITIRQILGNNNITKMDQISRIINQIEEEIQEMKVSEKFLKTVHTLSTLIILPIITLLINWLLNSGEEDNLIMVILLLAICLMVIVIYYLVKPLLTQFLDSPYRKMIKLKRTLEDIIIIDYLS